jgi:hypothetical protein
MSRANLKRRRTDGADTSTIVLTETPIAETIARRAYELYERRGATPGAALDDWLEAEQELGTQNRSGAESA